MTISAEERHLINETLRIAEEGTTHMVPEVMFNPTSKYTDPKRYEQEVQTLFREFPIIIGHRSDVVQNGDFITHDADMLGRGANEFDPVILYDLHEIRVLGEKPIAGVDRFGPCDLACRDD